MFETKRGALSKMLKEANKIPTRERFKVKLDILLLAEKIALVSGDESMVKFTQGLMEATTKEEHEFNIATGIIKAKI